MTEAIAKRTTLPVYGEVSCWELAGLHEGRTLVCTSPRTLLHYLAAPGTRLAKATERNVGEYVTLEVEGPVADDGKPLRVVYRMSRDDYHDRISGSEQGILLRLLGQFAPEESDLRNGALMVRQCLIKGFVRL